LISANAVKAMFVPIQYFNQPPVVQPAEVVETAAAAAAAAKAKAEAEKNKANAPAPANGGAGGPNAPAADPNLSEEFGI
jgi:hypothetical protein